MADHTSQIRPRVPGPSTPAWGQAKQWIEDPIGFWKSCDEAYGEVFQVELGSLGTIVLFSNPRAVKQVFALPATAFECRHYNQQYEYVMGSESLLVQDGAVHRRQRQQLGPLLSTRLELPAAEIETAVSDMVEDWHVGEAVSIRRSMHLLVFRAMLKILLGIKRPELIDRLVRHYESDVIRDLGAWRPWQRFAKWHSELRGAFAELIQSVRSRPSRDVDTLFNQLVLTKDKEGPQVSEPEIQDHLLTLLTAGVDPTAIALSWALFWIHRSDDVRKRLVDEIVLASDGEAGRPSGHDYLQAVVQETLRMYPVVTTPSGRKLTEATELYGYQFPAGITLLPCTYLVHHREDLFPEPDAFRPDRFLERSFATYEYFPFGGGVRTCIGSSLAVVLMRLVLTQLLTRVRLRLSSDDPISPVRHGTLLAPADHLQLIVEEIA